jgi:citrate lyase subunit beta/citryl-CoA lyase/(S)-citramalyl-CoA lyase
VDVIVNLRRSFLYVPATRPERFVKAIDSGADMVCIDLEDSVAPDNKNQARMNVLKFCNDYNFKDSACEVVVRINTLKSADGLKDLLAISESENLPHGVVLTKVESPNELEIAESILGDREVGLLVLIETPKGLRQAYEIVSSSKRLIAVMFGGGDYASSVGSDLSWDALLYARAQLAAATEGRIALIDVPCMKIDDVNGLESETKRVIKLGYSCKAAIHPCQIKTIHASFMPTDSEIEHAQQVVDSYSREKGGVVVVNGHMIDQPIVVAARRVLSMAGIKK